MTYEPKDQYGDYDDPEPYEQALTMAIEALTSQDLTEPNNTCEVDLISRADAIEAIQNAYCKPCKERGDDHNEVRCRACDYDNAIIQIDALPSAEAVSEEEHVKALNDLAVAWKNKLDEESYEKGYTAGQFADRPKGEWILDGGTPICSVCHEEPCWSSEGYDFTDFCPNCGCAMGGREE